MEMVFFFGNFVMGLGRKFRLDIRGSEFVGLEWGGDWENIRGAKKFELRFAN